MEIGPGAMIPYGAPVNPRDIENYRGLDPAGWLTRLVRGVLQAAITAEGLQYLVPQVTDRIRTADGGIDASLTIEMTLPGPRTAGLVNSGRTIYQFKWRSKRDTIFQAARGELKKLNDRHALPDYYVFVTNTDLSIPEHDRIKHELRKGFEEFPADHIVVVGASELTDRVNNDPRIRVAHFAVALGICTLDVAQETAERRYGQEEAVPPLFNREEELSTLNRFLQDPRGRAIVVYGPQGVGKTRIVLEALSSIPEQVVWAREVPIQPAGLIQVLDESPYPAVLVVDDVEAQPDLVLRKALEASRLKVVLISSWGAGAPGSTSLRLSALSASNSDTFLGNIFPKTSTSHRSWLYYQFGGLPGLLLQGATALQAGVGPDPLQQPEYEAILHAYEERMTRGLGPAADALAALSVLPRFKVHAGSTGDLETLCVALGLDIGRVLANIEVLKARNFIEEAGYRDGFFRVTPPLLGRRIAKRSIRALAGQFSNLYRQFSPEGKAGLVRRIAELQEEPAVRDFLYWLFSERGLFASVDSVASDSASIRALAETIPIPASRELQRVLEGASSTELRDRLTGDDRREIVHALEALIHRQDTFEGGARGLLCLAEAENEHWSNNASGVFIWIFHWKHPDIPKDARLRASLLANLARSGSPRKRVLVAEAAGHCLRTSFVVHAWQGVGVAPPEPGWRATAWGEPQDAIRRVVDLLRQLAVDSDATVRNEAIQGLSRGAGGILEVGLIEEAVGALAFLETISLDGSQRARLVEGVAFLVALLRHNVSTAEDEEWRAALQAGIERCEALFSRLTSANFRSRFFHWLGPAPMRARRRIGEHAEHGEIVEQGKRLAEEVISNPSLFEDELRDWVTEEHAENGGYFLFHLGELDRGRTWLAALEARLDRRRGVSALGIYLAGWFSATPAEANRYLDTIAGRGSTWSEAAADATWRSGGDPQGVKRLLTCIKEGGIDRTILARQLTWGWWHKALALQDFLEFVAGVRDGTTVVDWGLLESMHMRWEGRREEWDQLGPVAVEILFNTAGEASPKHESYHWDSLAAALVEWNPSVAFTLLFAHFEKGEQGRGIFFPHHRQRLIQELSSRDRPRLIRMFLERALGGVEPWRMGMELPYLLHPATDSEVILQFAAERGLEAARVIAENLDASQAGFWDMIPDFIARWGEDAEVRSSILHSVTWIRGVYSSRAATLRPRLEPLDRLSSHQNPLVRDVAHQAREALLRELRTDN